MIINTSRGAIVDASAVSEGLKSERSGYLGLDVYEQKANFFAENLSELINSDNVLQASSLFRTQLSALTGLNVSNTRIANLTDVANRRLWPTT